MMRSVCILNSDVVNERNGEVEKSEDEGIEKDQSLSKLTLHRMRDRIFGDKDS